MSSLHWRNNSLIHRFDKLADEADTSMVFQPMTEQLSILEIELMQSLEPDQQILFREWQDKELALEYMKKEWIYVRGVQDGIKILSQLYSE
ncbi:hypothetical protein PC41400_27100 [Paenibacillus chitinolyticus]|uniref:Uncharacterized protein n=1 Tax=Paenibacillus chitinolyticus TaxID=79263 RepID=A0A410X3E2_9BACL|nr:hypothetical protein [Paenibacillus chitinolyticus]MCY9592998.1 hypothetical protein [Paenibacillus chitinolyticus]MCY9598932.1 hypothetical protein [Paenibacillus chitinolyticus]QAV21144.1 hypothetical protein PC41400_27100 [Paenibacillus chitinolyticus]